MDEDILTELGLSQNEAKVYVSLLKLGVTTTTYVAKESKLHRSNVYDSMKKLVEKGLASYIKKEKVTLYEACNPKFFLNILKEREEKFREIMPQLELRKNLAPGSQAHVFEGVPAFMKVLYGLLDYKEPILIYGLPQVAPEVVKYEIPHFHRERIKKKIQMDHIYNSQAKERREYLNKMSYTTAKYLPPSFDSQASTTVCGDQVILNFWTTKPLLTIQIKNQAIAETYKKYFALLFKAAKY
ncbi:MAG: helix-turn-helix domain-containing protein [archaeon]